MKRLITWALVALMTVTLPTSSLAGVVETTSAVVDVTPAPPASVVLGATESDSQILLFTESTNVALPEPTEVDISLPGAYHFPPDPATGLLTPATIAAGTCVNSYFLHFDRVTNVGFTRLTGSATFDLPIIGVIVLTSQLDASDATLGHPGTTYPIGTAAARGLEFEEVVTLSDDRRTLSVELEIPLRHDNTFDQIRVITECPPRRACPKTQGFWENHPEVWPVTSLTLGGQTYSQAELLTILNTPPRGDASLILAHQLIAAKLNVANGADSSAIGMTITHADNLLNCFSGRLPYGVRRPTLIRFAMIVMAFALDRYNNGALTPGCAQ